MKKTFLIFKPAPKDACQNMVRDFVYGCWCNGRRIGGMQMPPLVELSCATYARSESVGVLFIDEQADPERAKALAGEDYRSIDGVLLMSSTQSFQQDVGVLEAIKKKNAAIKGILFGSHPTFAPEYCLRAEAVDYIIRREPEQVMRELLHALAADTPVDDLLGIGYRLPDGTPRIAPDAPFMNLDDLPIPDRSLLPAKADYFNPVVHKLPYTTMQTSRGCPGRCVFCTAPSFYGNKYRFRSSGQVLQELEEIQRLGYKEVFIRDETFTAIKKRNLEICQGILDRGIQLSWIANGRVDMVDREQLLAMKQAGCHMVKFGVESGVDAMLSAYKKGTTVAQAREVFRLAHEVGLETHAHLVFGGPGETEETLRQTIQFVCELQPTTASFGILTPYTGTPLFDAVAEAHPEILDGSASTMESLHTEGFFSEAICGMSGDDLHKMIKRAYRTFYFRPSYLLRRIAGIRSFEHFLVLMIAGLNIFKFSLSGKK